MSKIFFYTFRTNRFVGELEVILGERIFVIEKPAQDFAKLKSAIERSGAELVVGIGMVKGESRWESSCYNRIGNNVINSDFPERLSLDCFRSKIPAFLFRHTGYAGQAARMTEDVVSIPVGEGMTFGFCNYVAFRVRAELDAKLKNGFLHLNVRGFRNPHPNPLPVRARE